MSLVVVTILPSLTRNSRYSARSCALPCSSFSSFPPSPSPGEDVMRDRERGALLISPLSALREMAKERSQKNNQVFG